MTTPKMEDDAYNPFKFEEEFDGHDFPMLGIQGLCPPFRIRRLEKNNNNGEMKQAKLEIRKQMINSRCR